MVPVFFPKVPKACLTLDGHFSRVDGRKRTLSPKRGLDNTEKSIQRKALVVKITSTPLNECLVLQFCWVHQKSSQLGSTFCAESAIANAG